jgi:hypothetical protein
MFRRAVWLSLALLVTLSVRAAPAQTPDIFGQPPEPRPALLSGYLNGQLITALAQRIDFAGFADPNLTLGEALDTLAKRYDLTFDINERALALAGVKDIFKVKIARPVPAMPCVTVAAVVRTLLERIPAAPCATYLIRRDTIEITTVEAAAREGVEQTARRLSAVVVETTWAELDRPLSEVCALIADLANVQFALRNRIRLPAVKPEK